jgi:AraC-like DNA-binding protein
VRSRGRLRRTRGIKQQRRISHAESGRRARDTNEKRVGCNSDIVRLRRLLASEQPDPGNDLRRTENRRATDDGTDYPAPRNSADGCRDRECDDDEDCYRRSNCEREVDKRVGTRIERRCVQQCQRFRVQNLRATGSASPRYVRMVFAAENEHPSAYVLRRRLDEYAEQLCHKLWLGRSITETAFDWGFTSPACFTRTFKQQFGVTPTAYRHACGSPRAVSEQPP